MTGPTRLNGSVNRDTPLATRLSDAEIRVRTYPTQVSHRWELFQLLCVLGQWERAIQQLQVCAKQQPDQIATAHACRDLIRAERLRTKVFAGEQPPGFLFEPPPWVQGLVDALRLSAHGDIDSADRARSGARRSTRRRGSPAAGRGCVDQRQRFETRSRVRGHYGTGVSMAATCGYREMEG
jgi:type VI secretion system protein ImpE